MVWYRFLRRYKHNHALKLGFTQAEIYMLKSGRAMAQWTDKETAKLIEIWEEEAIQQQLKRYK